MCTVSAATGPRASVALDNERASRVRRTSGDAGGRQSTRAKGSDAARGASELLQSNPLLTTAARTLGSVGIGRESLEHLEKIGAKVRVLSDAEYDRAHGSTIGNARTVQRGSSFSSVITLRESALKDPRLGAALLAHEIEHAYLKHTSRNLRDGSEADAERREAAVKQALGVDPVAGNG